MAYTKQTWLNNDPSKPINDDRLNHIEDGIFLGAATADAAAATAASAVSAAATAQSGVDDLDTLTTSGRLSEANLESTFGPDVIAASPELAAVYPPRGEMFTMVTDPEFGAVGDALTDDTAAFQAAIDAAAARSVNGETYGGIVYVPPGVYMVGEIFLKTGVYIVGHRRSQGYREGPSRMLPYGLAAGEYMINQSAAIRQCGVIGISSYAVGSGSDFGWLNLDDVDELVLDSLHIDNYGLEAVKIDGGNARISNSFFRGLFDASYLTEQRGTFHLAGADHQVSHCEFTGPATSTTLSVTSANLYAAAAMLATYDSSFDTNVYQLADIGAAVTGGSRNRHTAERFDTNAGHGLVLANGTYDTFTGCFWSRNSRHAAGTYDHIQVASGGGSLNQFAAPMFANNGTNARYCINDAKSSGTFFNRYLDPWGEAGASGFYNITGTSTVRIPENAPVDITGATPSVLNRSVFRCADGSATTVTDFLNGVPGQRILILGSNTNTTIQHNGSTIVTKAGANIALAAAGAVEFVKRGSQWREV